MIGPDPLDLHGQVAFVTGAGQGAGGQSENAKDEGTQHSTYFAPKLTERQATFRGWRVPVRWRPAQRA